MSGRMERSIGPRHASVLVFVASACVLVLEILAGRLLAPYAGVTLQTFTAIIGTILAGIALGAWLGGRLADQLDPMTLLGPEIALGGVLAYTAPPLVRLLGPDLAREPLGLVLVVTVAVMPAATVLSAVTPTVIKIRLAALDETGRVVGRLSAVGTLGAIVGTFVTGFVLVAQLPSTGIIVAVGTLLVAWGAWLWWQMSGGGLMAAVIVAGLLASGAALASQSRCDLETAYYCVRVETDADRPSGRSLWLDTLRHAYVDLDDLTHLEFAYTRMFAAVVDATSVRPLDAVHLGGGGFSMPRWLDATRPGSTGVVLELDPGLIEIARSDLGLRDMPDVDIRVGDARVLLGEIPPDSADLVIGDAFGGVAAPWHLATREVATRIDEVLRPDGVYVLNVIDRRSMSFLRAELATLADVFPHVVALGHDGTLRTGGNVVVAASRRPIDLDAVLAEARSTGLEVEGLAGPALEGYVSDAPVLKDEHAPVDQLFDRAGPPPSG